jgi:hypothetical protein
LRVTFLISVQKQFQIKCEIPRSRLSSLWDQSMERTWLMS